MNLSTCGRAGQQKNGDMSPVGSEETARVNYGGGTRR